MKKVIGFLIVTILFCLTSAPLFSGVPGQISASGSKVKYISPETLMQIHKVLAKQIAPVGKNSVYNPMSPLRKKHIFNVIGKTILSNIPQTSSYTEAYNAALYYKKAMPEGFNDLSPKSDEMFGIAERLLGRNLISREKDGKLHSGKIISRAEALLHMLKLLEYTDLSNVRISDIYNAGMKLNTHLSMIRDVSANKLQIPGFIKIAQHYNLIPYSKNIMNTAIDTDFYTSFNIDMKRFYYQKNNKMLFRPNVKANLGFLTTILANNFIKWDFSASDYEKNEVVGNFAKLPQNRVLKNTSFTDAHLLNFDVSKKLMHLRGRKTGEQLYKDITLAIPDDCYIWVINKAQKHNLKGKKRLLQLKKVLKQFDSPSIYRISTNIILKNSPMKLDTPMLENIRISSNISKRLPQIAYLEVIINYFDDTGIISKISQDKVTIATKKGIQTYWFLPESRMKVRIHTIIKELNNTLFDKMLDPENLPFYKNNKLSFLKKGFHVRLKLMSSDQSTVKLLLVPFLKIGMLSQIAPSRNAIMSNFCANKYYRTTSSFGNIPLYSISSRERHGFRNSSLASLIQLDGSIKPSLLYVQPATAKPYDISRKRIPLKSKIDLVVGVE